MNRKPKVRKASGPRNPFVAVSLFLKAGEHRKSEKAIRRQENVRTGFLAQLAEHRAFTPKVADSVSAGPTRALLKSNFQKRFASLAQMDRASDFYSGCRPFESATRLHSMVRVA